MKADDLKARLVLSGPPLTRIPSAPPIIPDHKMVRCIGQGSYGEVWLARNAVGTFRAVKVVYRDNFKDARPYEREFSGIQKYEPISRSNEGLVDVLQIGRNDGEGYFYYIMELADDRKQPVIGNQYSVISKADDTPELLITDSLITDYSPKTLSREIHTRGRLPHEECITLGLTLNLALGHLHRHGLIHRDVKPSNIIFVNGVPKLADIGLVTDSADAQSFVGTEGFIPPEGPNSPQADIYALGKVLYEASMGKDRQEFPEPFTSLGLDAESKALMELNAVLLKACAANPKERYQSAEDMNVDLALLHSGKSVKNKHAVERRLRIMTRVGVVSAAVIVLGAFPYYLALKEARLAKAMAKQEAKQRDRALTEAAKSEQVAQFLKDMLKGVGPSAALGRDTTMLKEVLDKTAERIAEGLKDQPAVEAELRGTIGQVYFAIGQREKAEAMHRVALAIRRRVLPSGHLDIAASLHNLLVGMVRDGKAEEAEPLAREALAIRKNTLGDGHLAVAESLTDLGSVLHTLALANRFLYGDKAAARWQEAEACLREALAMRRRLLRNEHPDIVESIHYLMVLLLDHDPFGVARDKNLAEAEALAREGLAMRRKLLGEENPDVAWSLRDIALVLSVGKKTAEAERFAREAMAMRTKLLPPAHLQVGDSIGILARALRDQGKMDEAEVLYRESIAIQRKVPGSENPNVPLLLHGLAVLLERRGKLSEAESIYRETVGIGRKLKRNEYFRVETSLCFLGELLDRQHQLREAESCFREAAAISREARSDGVDLGKILRRLAATLQDEGKTSEAEVLFHELAPYNRRLAIEGVPDAQNTLACMYMKGSGVGKDPAEAVRWFRKAAEQGEETAQANLAVAYRIGEGVTKDLSEAIKWDRKAAEQGSPKAQVHLGKAYAAGEGVTKDMAEAVKWLRKAAESGDSHAQNETAWLLATCDDPKIRDGRAAVELAEKATAVTGRKDAENLDTLAAAYAEAGDFAKAVAVETEAMTVIQDEKEKQSFASRLRLYHSSTPYRER